MLVGERMSHPVVFISPDLPIQDALQLMRKESIRRLPVVKNGKLVGIVSDKELLNASPSQATSLSVWELNYLLSKITVSEVMTAPVIVVTEDTPIEEAARIMADNKIGGLPVMRGGSLVGIITETDIFRLMLELTGAREIGVRASFLLKDKPGELGKVTSAVAELGGNVIAVGTFAGDDQLTRGILMKVGGLDEAAFRKILDEYATKVKDVRFCCD